MSSNKNPWQILDQQLVYENPWIRVTEFQVLNPSGGRGIYGKVHFKGIAVGIIPLDEEFNIYLVGQYRFPLDQYSWEIPEGATGMEEDPLPAAKRELMEETGLAANEWTRLLSMQLSNSVTDEQAVIFLARGLVQHSPRPEETESLAIKKIPFEEAFKMVETGGISDSISVAAIQQVQLMLLQGRIKK
jgi:8-oxo-dGTP pyrophosphatase MutT (NUDIX family)